MAITSVSIEHGCAFDGTGRFTSERGCKETDNLDREVWTQEMARHYTGIQFKRAKLQDQ